MKSTIKIIIVLLLITAIAGMSMVFTGCDNVDKETEVIYTILQLSDPQYELPFALSVDTTEMITQLIESVNPDLIVITGDLTGSALAKQNYPLFMEFLDTFQIPFAVVFGNHDAEFKPLNDTLTKEDLAGYIKSAQYSVFEDGPELTGLGNYIVDVPNPDGGTAWSLFMLDSNMYDTVNGGYDYIHQDQIDWYTSEVNTRKVANGGSLNSLAFFHIPFQEYLTAWELKDTDQVTYHFGEKREGVCSSNTNSGLFQTMVDLGSTKGVFVGHDHVNDFSITYQGIRLTYGLKSGYGSYFDYDMTGGLAIKLTRSGYSVEQIFANTWGNN